MLIRNMARKVARNLHRVAADEAADLVEAVEDEVANRVVLAEAEEDVDVVRLLIPRLDRRTSRSPKPMNRRPILPSPLPCLRTFARRRVLGARRKSPRQLQKRHLHLPPQFPP